MARCGCNTATSNTCEAIMTCIASALGAGLDYNETTGQLELDISGDTGNVASIGTDSGLFAPEVVGPGPMTWPLTVATLSADVMAAASGSNLVGPATAPHMMEYCIANRIEIYSTPVHMLADMTIIEQITGPTTSVTTFTDNPGPITSELTSSLTLQQMLYDAGTRVNPTSRNSDAPAALLTPDGGWGGFYAPTFKPRTIDELLRQARGRIVVELLPQRVGLTTEVIEETIVRCVAAVVAAGAQEWVIIQVPALLDDESQAPINDWVAIVTDAGIAAGVNATAENQMPDPFTAAEIVASGAQWVMVTGPSSASGVTDARITELVTAGLQVSVTTNARQYWTSHAFGLGARVVRAPDVVYAQGSRGVVGDLNYRQPQLPGVEMKTANIGALTPVSDTTTAMWNVGFARNDLPGRWFPLNYAWSGSTSVIRNNQLLGNICPIPDTTNYRIEIRIRRDSDADPDNRSAGIFFAAPDDRGIHHLVGNPVSPTADGYSAELNTRVTGTTMILRRVTDGVATTLGSVVAGAVNFVANTWITLAVNVAPSGITFTAVNGAATSTITSADTTWRGAYAFHIWDDQLGPMVHGYDNPADLLTYEDL